MSGKQIVPTAPLLYLIPPALRVHPATEVVLRYVSPDAGRTLIASTQSSECSRKINRGFYVH